MFWRTFPYFLSAYANLRHVSLYSNVCFTSQPFEVFLCAFHLFCYPCLFRNKNIFWGLTLFPCINHLYQQFKKQVSFTNITTNRLPPALQSVLHGRPRQFNLRFVSACFVFLFLFFVFCFYLLSNNHYLASNGVFCASLNESNQLLTRLLPIE